MSLFKSTIETIEHECEFLRYENSRMGRVVKNYDARMNLLKKIADLCADYDDGNIQQTIKKEEK